MRVSWPVRVLLPADAPSHAVAVSRSAGGLSVAVGVSKRTLGCSARSCANDDAGDESCYLRSAARASAKPCP
jgi:hypothetical protein